MELVLITSDINAHKRRDVAVVNIPGEFLTTDMDKDVIRVLQRRVAELMVKTEQSIYQIFVTIENVQMVLYLKSQKALYGCLRSALLFYDKLVLDLNLRAFINHTIHVYPI